jgi:hypothetical protein
MLKNVLVLEKFMIKGIPSKSKIYHDGVDA